MTMTDKPKPKCPYCGENMRPRFYRQSNGVVLGDYRCYSCYVDSPQVEHEDMKKCREMAYEAAMRRPLQKPIEKDELFGSLWLTPCWIEVRAYSKHDNGWCRMFADVLDADSVGYFARIYSNRRLAEKHYYSRDDYNIAWRCWATRPTDEELAAAEWED